MLEWLEKRQARFCPLHQERGLCHVALKDSTRAIDALLRGVNIDPALPASWSMLEGFYRLTGDNSLALEIPYLAGIVRMRVLRYGRSTQARPATQ